MKVISRLLKQPLFWIFILALVLRVYKLGTFPFGFHADEARVGWNALSILKTGKDDKGNKLALYYNTFGDYRPTGIFYTTIPSIVLFGRSEFAVRFPSALLGALTVFPLFLFVFELLKSKDRSLISDHRQLAPLSALLLAINPWHIEVSRATSEVVMSTFFGLFALYFFIRLIKTHLKKFAFLSTLCITISYLLYHAVRFLAPAFYLTILIYYLRGVEWSKIKKTILGVIVVVFTLSLYFSLNPLAKKRFSQVSIFSDIDINYEIDRIRSENQNRTIFTTIFDNKEVIFTRRFLEEYPLYFGGGFLLSDLARPFRYITPGVGLLTYVEIIFLVLGLTEMIKRKRNLLPLFLLLIAPIPAAITTEDALNLHRAFFMLPFLIIIEAYGLWYIYSSRKKFFKLSLVFLVSNFLLFGHMYLSHSYSHKPFIKNLILDASSFRNVGTKELVLVIDKETQNYDKIVITNFPDNPYPWYAFFIKKDPLEFNRYIAQGARGEFIYKNIVFSNLKCPSDESFLKYNEKRLLVIDSWECAYQSKIKDGLRAKVVNKIIRKDGSEVYIFMERI